MGAVSWSFVETPHPHFCPHTTPPPPPPNTHTHTLSLTPLLYLYPFSSLHFLTSSHHYWTILSSSKSPSFLFVSSTQVGCSWIFESLQATVSFWKASQFLFLGTRVLVAELCRVVVAVVLGFFYILFWGKVHIAL